MRVKPRPIPIAHFVFRFYEAFASARKNVSMLICRKRTNRYSAGSLESKPNGQDKS
jgi:hypothetical protein